MSPTLESSRRTTCEVSVARGVCRRRSVTAVAVLLPYPGVTVSVCSPTPTRPHSPPVLV
jgi:hypothetical protein